MIKVNIGIEPKNLKGVNELLGKVLADAHVLYVKTRNYHWNVSGPSFMELHKLFEGQYKILEEAIDEIAERIGKLGGVVPGSMTEFIKMASLKENVSSKPDRQGMLKNLLDDHENVIKTLREDIDACDEKYKDAGTADFLTDLIRSHETMAWTLRRYVAE